jgi:hypothetical protein
MMPRMFGDHRVIQGLFTIGFLLYASSLWACPACVVSDNSKSTENFIMLSAMGVLPLIVALVIGLAIVRIVKNGKA